LAPKIDADTDIGNVIDKINPEEEGDKEKNDD
jgi:hypothetical protein